MLDNTADNKQVPVEKPKLFYGYIVAFIAFIIMALAFGAQYTYGIFFKSLEADFGWSRTSISIGYTINMAIQAVIGIFAGRLNDRFGPRILLTVCGILAAGGYFLMSTVTEIWQVWIYFGFFGSMLMTSSFVALMSTIARWFIKLRGLISGVGAAGIGFGMIVMPLLAGQLISTYNWRTSYMILAAILLVLTVVGAQFLRRTPQQMGLLPYGASTLDNNADAHNSLGVSLMEAIRTRQFWIFSIGFLMFSYCLQSVMVHSVPYASDQGLPRASAVWVLSIIGFISLLSKIGLGGAADKVGIKRITAFCFIMLIFAFFWVQAANLDWMFWLFAIIFGIGYGGYVALESPMIAELFGLKAHGAIFGLFVLIGNVGSAVGPLITGGIFDISGSYHYAFMICAVFSIACFILTIMLKPVIKSNPG